LPSADFDFSFAGQTLNADIKPLNSRAAAEIEALLDAAFGKDRHGRAAYAIRAGMNWLPQLSFALSNADGSLIGLLQSWPVAIQGDNGISYPLAMIGPVAVLPEHQGEGHGRRLMDHLIALVDNRMTMTTDPLVMIGDPEYYGHFWGFSAEETAGWRAPGAVEQRRLLCRNCGRVSLPATGILGPRRTQNAA
jgi:predicted N-acetyltransferase YhbS